ncbi:D-alanyl-D-alanine carboxypeptidase/D-alanyl-D-alanine endopeptidase [Legionella fallonii]|uniref:Putative D-Ala-D-Ala carboxypeptidase n=1 Tax=Legionella fallonii LLAP-10 TaxID=1212491 RepID=A0A098G990_9GAMM|nr:D-alanyl-D-alanine carboxypeptidase/D-alanyl-D-alanine-endopeptidase [Legionella fallonii]CEG58574.1 putative D-Ala-D-Ala carboxypeptidase [Legionella fallonii LLAP-10]
MKRSMFVWFLLIYFVKQVVYAQTLPEKIDALIKKELPLATVGILVKDAQTGQVIYKKNADTLLYPASNIKLFTAASALYQLKPNYHFLTTLSQKNNNFYITFTGSPSLTIAEFSDLLLKIKKSNSKTINGNIIIDSTHFKAPAYPGGVSYDDLGWYYTAPTTALILNENAETYEVISSKKLRQAVTIKPKAEEKNLTIINQIISVDKEEEKDHCSFNIEIEPHNTLRLYGCMVQEKAPKAIQLAVPDPVYMAKDIIKKTLKQNNLTLKGQILEGKAPLDAQVIAQHQSHDLVQLITHMLKESDNLYANSLTKELAFSVTKEGSIKQGIFAMKQILAEHTNVNMNQIELTDGMGTRYNLATPRQLVLLLANLYNDKELRPIIIKALPQAGVSGTLIGRMKKTKLEKLVIAKTGTMHDISSLSGYIVNPKARTLIFSIIINGVNKPINVAKTLEEQILLTIVGDIPSTPEIENAYG